MTPPRCRFVSRLTGTRLPPRGDRGRRRRCTVVGQDVRRAGGRRCVRGGILRGGFGWSSERGAAAVEFAVISVVLVMLLLGIVSFGLTLYQNIALEGAAREAARFGATYPVDDAGGVESWLRGVAQVAEDAAVGALGASEGTREICVAYGGGDAAGFSRVIVTGAEPVAAAGEEPGWCFENSAPGTDTVVQVHLERAGWIEGIVYSAEPTLVGEAALRYERSGP